MAIETPVVFENHGQQLVGMWHEPASQDANRGAAVVFCHGFTGHKAESQRIFVKTARTLAATGVACLRFDYRGSGDSEGEFVQTTVSGQVSDAIAAVEFASRQAGVNSSRIGLLGLSLGGLVTALALPDLPKLAAIVLWNPVADAVGVARRRSTPASDAQLAETGIADYQGWAVGKAFLSELPTLTPHAALQTHPAPVYILLGEIDESVPNADGLSYADARRQANLPVEVRVIPGAGHTFASLQASQVAVQETVEWISAQLITP